MSENVRKLVGVVAMAALVAVGVVTTSGGDDDFTRNGVFAKLDGFRELPEAQQARLAPAFLEQAAPKSLDTGPIGQINNEVGPIFKGAKASVWSTSGTTGLSTGKASVLKGTGVDGKGGTSSYCTGYCISGSSGTAGTSSLAHAGTASPSYPVLSGRKAGIWLQSGGVEGVADRIEKLGFQQTRGLSDSGLSACNGKVVDSLKNVLVTSYGVEQATDEDHKDWVCSPSGDTLGGQEGEALKVFPKVEIHIAELLAECMESKVGDVFLKSHIEVSAADCVATVMPAISPKRAKQLGTYWQTQQQLGVWTNGNATSVWTNGNATSVWTNEE